MSADRNLTLGLLAVHNGLLAADVLVAAFAEWRRDPARPFGDFLRAKGHLSAENLERLDALVDGHLRRQDDDAAPSAVGRTSIAAATHPFELADGGSVHDTLRQAVGAPRPGNATAPPTSSPTGRYRVVRPHAKGGLGEVFVAEDTELNRRVALKEIQARYADDLNRRRRFVAEAEITGALEHPGVVPVYGLGAYPDGRPFYAMRFVEGVDLAAALKRFHARSPRFDALAFRKLLTRFVDVCNAVAYAHSRGVLHRDLKPGNVMLGPYGETLLVDWGLARVGPGGDTQAAAPVPAPTERAKTMAGELVGTPWYMSPEQASARPEAIGPATDVFGLGATLYELLTGKTAYDGADNVDEVLRRAAAGEFPRPRAVLPAVPPALEAVCLKAMALAPANRYETALALAQDVERWLADEPVSAYREPAVARARRWIRRHARLATGIAAALVVGLMALGVVAWQAERSRRAVTAERDRALEARAAARAALDAMTSDVTGEALTTQHALAEPQRKFLRDVLTRYEAFAAEPGEDRAGRERLASAHARIGAIRQRLGQREPGAAAFARAADLYAALAADFPSAPEYRRAMAANRHHQGTQQMGLARFADAEASYRAALAVREQLATEFPNIPDYRLDLAASHNDLALLFDQAGRRSECEAPLRAAVAIHERLAAEHPDEPRYRAERAMALNNLGALYVGLNRLADAEATFRTVLALREGLVAETPASAAYRSDLTMGQHNLAFVLARRGETSAAEALYRAALTGREKLAAEFPTAPRYRSNTAVTHSRLGALFTATGRHDEALAAHRAAVALMERLTADYPEVPDYRRRRDDALLDTAGALAAAGRPDAAAAMAEGVAEGATAGPTLYNCAAVLARVAGGDESRAARAVALLRRAFAGGYRDVPHMQKDADLAGLRRRDDFAALLWDVADGVLAR